MSIGDLGLGQPRDTDSGVSVEPVREAHHRRAVPRLHLHGIELGHLALRLHGRGARPQVEEE